MKPLAPVRKTIITMLFGRCPGRPADRAGGAGAAGGAAAAAAGWGRSDLSAGAGNGTSGLAGPDGLATSGAAHLRAPLLEVLHVAGDELAVLGVVDLRAQELGRGPEREVDR